MSLGIFLRAAVLACSVLPVAAHAQPYPVKPVRMIVTCPPGCSPDILGRAIGQPVSQVFGQPVVVENRAGANGNIGMDACAKAAPDGYTLCMSSNVTMSLNPFAYEKLPFEPQQMVPIIHLGNLDQAIAVHASLPARDIRELVELARAKPGGVAWASLGNGSTSHLYLEWFSAKTGAKFLHVPYKGSPEAIRALAAAEVMVTTLTPRSLGPLIASNRVRVLAVVSGSKRSPLLPEVPSLAEQGYELDFRNWFALFFPKDTGAEPVQRWNTEVNKLLAERSFTEKYFASAAMTPTGGTPADLAAIARASRKVGAELVNIAKLKFE